VKRNRYNLTETQRKHLNDRRRALFAEKELVYVTEPVQLYCDDKSHPLFSINVTLDKQVSTCYYCSKTWILTLGM